MAILLWLILIIALFSLVPWLAHISMVQGSGLDYGWTNYNTFIKVFDKYEWTNDPVYKNSLFHDEDGSRIHANIYRFGHKGMIMRSPVDYYRSVFHIKKQYNEVKPKNKIDWNKELQ
ncbi:hypothetical protein ANABIO32_02230 [Rossellomorea marisflavi]|uniref:hypothetical protein n=1 Tax=Rossellomorea marisflavi TaxID=189381 RepID=UPI0025CAB6B6|nr:hypothetical protein [Rossellomorea marisflavi]GLI82536.1 hypothetical protein ANABIO32_02230 [Rossellomorea marisflavi]